MALRERTRSYARLLFSHLSLVAALAAICWHPSSALAQSFCTEGGGDYACRGPLVSPWRYQVSDGWSGGQGGTEAEAIENYRAAASVGMCTFLITDDRPAPQTIPAGHGHSQNGDYSGALFYAVGQFWSLDWTLSTETQQERIPLRIDKTFGPSGCGNSVTHGAYVLRGRDVFCPAGYDPNGAPTDPPYNAYCMRAPWQRDPPKNLGQQCPVSGGSNVPPFGNPTNGTTGNKFQAETDYAAAGASPLKFARYYNSQLTSFYPAGNVYNFGVRSTLGPNWRSSYERGLRFAESSVYPTAEVYRPDGQTLTFKLLSGQFVADKDVADRLAPERVNDFETLGCKRLTSKFANIG